MVHSNPFHQLNNDFEQLFGRMLDHSPLNTLNEWFNSPGWGVEVLEKEQEVVVRAELPGFEVSDLDVQLTNNVLTIDAKRFKAEDQEQEKASRPSRQVHRAFTLPEGLDHEKFEAAYRNGVLEIHVPRLPQTLARKIDIKG